MATGTNLCYEVLYLLRDAMELVTIMGEDMEDDKPYYTRKVADLRSRADELLSEHAPILTPSVNGRSNGAKASSHLPIVPIIPAKA